MEQVPSPKLKISSRKLLAAVSLLEGKGYEGSAEGLAKLLTGVEDAETLPFGEMPLYGYWPSLSKKKIKGRLTQLVRHGYLANVYKEEEGDYFFVLTDLGRASCIGTTLMKKAPKGKCGAKTIIPITKGEKRE